MAAAQLDRDILNCIYFRTVNRVTVTPVISDLKYQIYSGRRCASVGRIYTQEQEQEQDRDRCVVSDSHQTPHFLGGGGGGGSLTVYRLLNIDRRCISANKMVLKKIFNNINIKNMLCIQHYIALNAYV